MVHRQLVFFKMKEVTNGGESDSIPLQTVQSLALILHDLTARASEFLIDTAKAEYTTFVGFL
jgi:hypothetical protein